MTTFEEVLAQVGIGNADLTLHLPSGLWPRGGEVPGKLSLHGGTVPQQIESLVVRLDELVTQGKSSEWKPRDERFVTTQFLTVPYGKAEWEFLLRVPDDARLSTGPSAMLWRVSVEADILWAVNPRAQAAIEVVPHYEVIAVQRALETAGFTKTNMYLDFAIRESPDTVVTYYKAPLSLREQVDGAALHLRVFGAFVHGRLILNRHQHSVGEHLLALVGADREEHPLQIRRDALLNDRGGPNTDGATPALQALLSHALILPDNADAKTLLRSASGPPLDSDTLLRPAAGTGGESNLLRPTDADSDPPETPSS